MSDHFRSTFLTVATTNPIYDSNPSGESMRLRMPPDTSPFLAVAAVTLFLLLIPLTAMQFTSEVRWGFGDFVVAACLIFGAGVGLILVARYTKRRGLRAALMGTIALALVVLWAELAVGIFT
jgi:hypothetical protein